MPARGRRTRDQKAVYPVTTTHVEMPARGRRTRDPKRHYAAPAVAPVEMPARGRRTRDHLGNFGEACYGPSRNARAGASYPRPVGRDVASLTRQVEMPARGASFPRLRHRVEFTTSPWSKCPRGGVVPATESPRLTPVRIPSKCPRGGVVPATGYLNTKILTCDQSKCPRAGASYPRQDLDHEHVLGRRESKCPRGGVVPATSALAPRGWTPKGVEMPARGRRTRDVGRHMVWFPARGRRTRDWADVVSFSVPRRGRNARDGW